MKYIIILVASLLFVSCGGDNEKKSKVKTTDTTIVDVKDNIIQLETGKIYTVYSGDKLEKTSDDTEVIINKNTKTEVTTVRLTQGSATITRVK